MAVRKLRPSNQIGNQNSIGVKISELRKKENMKQKELLAKMQTRGIDINPSSLSKLESQQRFVRAEEVKVIAEIFDITTDELLK